MSLATKANLSARVISGTYLKPGGYVRLQFDWEADVPLAFEIEVRQDGAPSWTRVYETILPDYLWVPPFTGVDFEFRVTARDRDDASLMVGQERVIVRV